MAACIHPFRTDNHEQNRLNQQACRDRVNGAISAEQNWLDGTGAEPDWPELPSWFSRPRRGIRIGARLIEEDDESEEQRPDQYVDEHTLGVLTGYLIRFTVGDLADWLVALAEHFMRWTCGANGPHGDDDRDRDNLPLHWNSHFFDFLGILCVALPHDVAVSSSR